ncbi:hypothetical protein ACRAWF_28995 [Streptomyces sp. L7]
MRTIGGPRAVERRVGCRYAVPVRRRRPWRTLLPVVFTIGCGGGLGALRCRRPG